MKNPLHFVKFISIRLKVIQMLGTIRCLHRQFITFWPALHWNQWEINGVISENNASVKIIPVLVLFTPLSPVYNSKGLSDWNPDCSPNTTEPLLLQSGKVHLLILEVGRNKCMMNKHLIVALAEACRESALHNNTHLNLRMRYTTCV